MDTRTAVWVSTAEEFSKAFWEKLGVSLSILKVLVGLMHWVTIPPAICRSIQCGAGLKSAPKSHGRVLLGAWLGWIAPKAL